MFGVFIKYQNSSSNEATHDQQVVLRLTSPTYQEIAMYNSWKNSNNAITQVALNEGPFYQDNPENRQAAKTQFIDIIKHVRPRIHHLEIDASTDTVPGIPNFNYYTNEEMDGTFLKPLSRDLVDNELAASPSSKKLSIEQTKFIDCTENGFLHHALTTLHLSYTSDFEQGSLSKLSARAPRLQDVGSSIDRKRCPLVVNSIVLQCLLQI